MKYTIDDLLEKMKEEGSYDDYYQYLIDFYGSCVEGQDAHLEVQKIPCVGRGEEAEFARMATEKDLYHKSLEKIYWMAEGEREFTNRPYFTAVDRYYRLNPPEDATKEEIINAIRGLEHEHHGEASMRYGPKRL